MTSLPEDPLELWKKGKEGSKQAFDLLYEQYFPFVFRIALKWTNNRYEAEDVSHDVLLDFFQRPGLYDPKRGSLEAFLAVKTKYKCVDVLRKRKRYSDREVFDKLSGDEKLALSAYANSPVEYLLSQEEKEAVRQALQQIPEAQRLALYGAYVEEMTQRHLAQQLKRPLGTVKSLIRYGLKNMRKHLEKYRDKPTVEEEHHG